MATTSPDDLRTPNGVSQYALTQDFGVLADTVQLALIRRGNLYVGTSSQRNAFTSATPGINWQDTDGTQDKYVRTASGWLMLGEKFYSGTSAQRTAFTTAPNGSHWQDIDGVKMLWRRDATTWVKARPDNTQGFGTLTPFSGSTLIGESYVHKDEYGIVTFYASAQRSAWSGVTSLLTFPVGFRPAASISFVSAVNGAGAPGGRFSQLSAAGVFSAHEVPPTGQTWAYSASGSFRAAS